MSVKTSRFLDEDPAPAGFENTFSLTVRTTPHSQLRQLSFGSLLPLTETSLPQALSEQFAEPIYAQAPSVGDVDNSLL